MTRSVRYWEFDGADEDGSLVSGSWRAWCCDAGMWRWEMRRVLLSAGYADGRANFQWSGVTKVELPLWRAAFLEVGLDPEVCYVRSIHAARLASEDVKNEDDVASFSLSGIIVLLLFWVEFRRQNSRKAIARFILQRLLASMMLPGMTQEFFVPPAQVVAKCEKQPIENGSCKCLRELLFRNRVGSPQVRLADLLLALFQQRTQCAAAMAMVGDIARRAETLAEHRMDAWTTGDRELVRQLTLAGNTGKRRRLVDSDLKQYVCGDVLKEGKSFSSAAWAKSHGEGSSSTASTWDESYLAEYLAGLRLTGMQAKTVCIAPDAARFGSPAQETLLIPCWIANLDFSCWLPPQVLPDWRHEAIADGSETHSQKLDQAAAAASSEQERARRELLAEVEDSRVARAKQKKDDPATERLANQHFIVAMENCLSRGLGLDLGLYLPKVRCEPLAKQEKRYFVFHKAPCDAEARRRSCILNVDTGDRRFEVVVSQKGSERFAPSLHVKVDQGSIGWPSLQWARCKVGLRMTVCFDPHHRWQRDITGAISKANLHGVKVDFGLVLNVALGPWSGDGHFGTIYGAAQQMKKEVDHTWGVYQVLYSEVCGEMGIKSPTMGSQEHMRFVWGKVLECPMFRKTGMGVKFGRWFQYEDKSCHTFGHRTSMLLLLLFVGSKKRWWRSLMESPLFQAEHVISSDDGDEGQAASVGPDGERQTVAQSNESLRQRRGSCKNSLHLTCQILADRVVRRVHRGMVRLVGPIRKFHGESLVKGKTKRGGLLLQIELAKGIWREVSAEVFELLLSARFVEELEFLDPAGGPYSAAELADDELVLKSLFSYALEVVGGTELTNLHYMVVPPFALVGLVADDSTQKECLGSLRTMWSTLTDFEQEMIENPALQKIHAEMIFARDHWFRELMVTLDESHFDSVPPFVSESVREFVLSFVGTKITEDAHNTLRDKNRHSKSKSMSPKERWHMCVSSSLLRDNDRVEMPITSAAKQVSTKVVPRSCFEWSGAKKFSLGLDMLRTLGESHPSWPIMTPLAYREMPMAWCAVSRLAPQFVEATKGWLALLLEPGQYVQIGGPEQRGLVLAVTEWGFLWMKVTGMRLGSIGHVEVLMDGKRVQIEPMQVGNVDVVKVLAVTPASPAAFSASSGGLVRGVKLQVGAPKSLLQSAARRAFPNLTVPRLEMLAMHLQIELPPRRPRTLQGWLEALINHCLPGIAAEELSAIVSLRTKPSSSGSAMEDRCQLLKAANLEVARHDLVGTEVEEAAKDLEEKRAKRRAQAGHKAQEVREPAIGGACAGGGASSSSASAVAAAPRPVMKPWESKLVWTAREASAFAPPGTSVSKQTTPHVRWQGHYKNKPPPNFTTKSFSSFAGLSEEQALLFVLSQLWRWHKEVAGVDCPYDLESALAGT